MHPSPAIDPLTAATAPDPYGFYARLVAEHPLFFDRARQLWVAASARVVADVLANPACRVRPAAEPVPTPLVGSAAGEVFGALVRMTDGDRHRALKRAVDDAFGTLSLSVVERAASIEARRFATDGPLDGNGVTRMALRFPIHVVATLLGVPENRLSAVAEATAAFAAGLAPDAAAPQRDDGSAALERLRAVIEAAVGNAPAAEATLLEAFRRETAANATGNREMVANAIGFLFQTCDATAGLIGNTIVTLGRRQDVLDRITREPHDLRAAIEEVVRFDPPVQNTRRFVESAGIVAGEAMQAGDVVLVLLAAANRDPAANIDPDCFDLRRQNRRAFTFGAGAHACPGAAIAVTIATACVQRLLAEGADPRPLAGSFAYRPSVNLRVPLFGGEPPETEGTERTEFTTEERRQTETKRREPDG